MPVWPPDGLWRITVPSGGSPIPVIPYAANGTAAYKGAVTAAGLTSIGIIPSPGNHMYLTGWRIDVSGNASRAAGASTQFTIETVTGGATVGGFTAFIPGAAGTVMGNDASSGWNIFSPAYRLALVNDTVGVRLGAALATGQLSFAVSWYELAI